MQEGHRVGLGPGLAGFVLVVVVAWALAAVLLLTGTLTNARQINNRVKLVNAQVGPIDQNLSFVKLAGTTGRVSGEILQAARPLSGQATQIITAAGHIQRNASAILTTARSINGVVHQINGNATAINGTVHAIGGNVSSIGSSVSSISSSVSSIGGNVGSIHSRVATVEGAVGPVGATDKSINADVTSIHSSLAKINTTAHSIRPGIVAINGRADVIIGLSQLLKSDFDNVLALVGTTIGTPTILGHANSIDCAPLINLLGATQSCGQ